MADNNNYIQINGKKIPLTNEQVEQIKNAGIVKDNPFERAKKRDFYYYIDVDGKLRKSKDVNTGSDNNCFDTANYCTDKKLLEQRALHEILNRLLWRFSMTHGGDEIEWSDNDTNKYRIYYNCRDNCFRTVDNAYCRDIVGIYFKDRQTAEQAIEEIVKPFMKEHPEFVW